MNILDRIIADMGCHHPDQDHTDTNGDPCCADCLDLWSDTEDNRGGFTFAYAH